MLHVIPSILNLDRIDIFIRNNFDYVIDCININRGTIYTTKCIDIVTLNVLPTSYFR